MYGKDTLAGDNIEHLRDRELHRDDTLSGLPVLPS
jgi:hypothetical protein